MPRTYLRLPRALVSASLLALAASGCDDTPDWAQEAELAALTTCDGIEATALVDVRAVSWWDTSLGLTFDRIHAEDLQACWIYEPLADGRGRGTLALEAAVWRPEPGERTIVRVDAAEVLHDHAEIQGGDGKLEFVLEDEVLMSTSTNWATWAD
jgi:hypothetical protein